MHDNINCLAFCQQTASRRKLKLLRFLLLLDNLLNFYFVRSIEATDSIYITSPFILVINNTKNWANYVIETPIIRIVPRKCNRETRQKLLSLHFLKLIISINDANEHRCRCCCCHQSPTRLLLLNRITFVLCRTCKTRGVAKDYKARVARLNFYKNPKSKHKIPKFNTFPKKSRYFSWWRLILLARWLSYLISKQNLNFALHNGCFNSINICQ